MSIKEIIVLGAKENNLKGVDFKIPRDKLVVFTGLSGSGKSSIAFDTIYAEGQRRYVESLSAYARQFLNIMHKPKVEHISGLSPAISIEQKTTSKNPRSTVGTVTEIYDYLRLLFARVGTPISPSTGLPIKAQQISDMVDRTLELKVGTKIFLVSPIVRDRKGEFKNEFIHLRKQGFQRIRVDGEVYDINSPPSLDKKFRHNIDVIVDRIVIKDGIETRLADSFKTAVSLSEGIAIVEEISNEDNESKNKPKKIIFSENFSCPVSGFTIEEIEPRLFSFNAPSGACFDCDGLGIEKYFDINLIIPNKDLSLIDGALSPWNNLNTPFTRQTIISLSKHYNFDKSSPWNKLPEKIKNIFLYGSGEEKIEFIYDENGRIHKVIKAFEGILPNIKRRFIEAKNSWIKEDFEKYRNSRACESCKGYRLNEKALCIKIGDDNIGSVVDLSIKDSLKWIENCYLLLSKQQLEIASSIIKEIQDRLSFLVNVGLDYLTLGRSAGTLSGGESQRIRLASQIGSGLTGVLYVLDEPSIGLHQRDNTRLLKTLKNLRDQGNTVIVVEHDEEAIREADYIFDIGPGAGIHGGYITAQGTINEICSNSKSLTGNYLIGKKRIPFPKIRRKGNGNFLCILGASGNNLLNVNVEIPLGNFVCITGVSGGGKSTLIIETLYKFAASNLNKSNIKSAPFEKITGLEKLDKVIEINQSPIGRTPRSNPATYTGAFTPIREWFSSLPESKARGYGPGRFSFNVKGGRCEACQGDGVLKIEMHFLSDVYVTCDSCKGKRYNRETLEVKYKNLTISDVLNLTVVEAAEVFKAVPSISEKMNTLIKVGLGYIKVGQQATTLSGGEAQRIKLSKELSKKATGRTLYILDEPTTGLHFEDINKLLEVLHSLVDVGNSVIVIEHNLDVIKTADYIIDIGPEGGKGGGRIVATGSPEELIKIKESHTAKYLEKILLK